MNFGKLKNPDGLLPGLVYNLFGYVIGSNADYRKHSVFDS